MKTACAVPEFKATVRILLTWSKIRGCLPVQSNLNTTWAEVKGVKQSVESWDNWMSCTAAAPVQH